MKKCIVGLVIAFLLTGCSARETFETLGDGYDAPAMAPVGQLELKLPQEAVTAAMENPDTGKLYLCDGYTLTVQTMDSGDLDETLRQLTGYGKEQLTVMETKQDGYRRIETVWTAAGEGGDQIGRAVILDDGTYHYAVTVMADAQTAGNLTAVWQPILDSVTISRTE